ncbi:MAG: nitronate monooxygenase, partial [Gemmatimonadaceae bacterium]
GIRIPIICGAMYPCSNPELVAAVSAAGAIGVYQPIALTYVHGRAYREGLRLMKRLAGGTPLGMNALIESSSRTYHEKMVRWVEIALEEGVRFFVTSLGNPRWVCDRVHAARGAVYPDVTELKWAQKGSDAGCDGLIAVNVRAGGHAGSRTMDALFDELSSTGLPIVCAGGVGSAADYSRALTLGYAGVQMGTRFIASTECTAHARYKQAIVDATERDIVLTERLTGVPVAVINTPYIQSIGLRAGPLARLMLRGRRSKRWMRTIYAARSLMALKRSNARGDVARDYWQAGRSVASIDGVLPVEQIIAAFEAGADSVRRAAQAPA